MFRNLNDMEEKPTLIPAEVPLEKPLRQNGPASNLLFIDSGTERSQAILAQASFINLTDAFALPRGQGDLETLALLNVPRFALEIFPATGTSDLLMFWHTVEYLRAFYPKARSLNERTLAGLLARSTFDGLPVRWADSGSEGCRKLGWSLQLRAQLRIHTGFPYKASKAGLRSPPKPFRI